MQTPIAKARIFLTGVGGQGTLTATTLLARTAMEQGLDVTSGEIHGMAQRGGVVESTVLLGGWKSPKLGLGEADILLGFEPLETLRALPYLVKGGLVVSSSEAIPPVAVSMGKAEYPALERIEASVRAWAGQALFLPCRSIGRECGAVQSGNIALLAALLQSGALPFGVQALEETMRRSMKPAILDVNLKALQLGAEAVARA